jgi:cyclopropane-fatty-acyl-phospholipid synthase
MKINRSTSLPLDKFIEWALYDKNSGYYMKKNPFGKSGDFVTAPNITRLFSEIIAIWTITFWKSIGSPKKFNLLELGAGNGEMMKVITETLKNFPECFNACNFIIHEKSNFLINQQKKKLNFEKISWVKDIKKINSYPTLYLANEFFDAIPIKQFFKKKEGWVERFVELKNPKKAEFKGQKINIKKSKYN